MGRIDIFNHNYGVDPLKPYASRIFNCSVAGANEVGRFLDGGIPKFVWLEIVFEFMFYYVALTKGRVLDDMEEDYKKDITNQLVGVLVPAAVDYIFVDPRGGSNMGLKQKYLDQAAKRAMEYDGFRQILPDRLGRRKESAMSHLCTKIGELVGHSGNSMFNLACDKHIRESLDYLKSDAFVFSLT